MGYKVCKFGGTSLANAEQIRKVCEIVRADPERRLVAVSAPGKRSASDTKVTDLLIACAEAELRSQDSAPPIRSVVERFGEIASELGLDDETSREFEGALRSRLDGDPSDEGRFLDGVKALGEEHCARLVARYLVNDGVEAHYVDPKAAGLLLSDEAGNARVLPSSFENLRALRERSGILIFPGFFGFAPSGALVTFPRGGTDITGAVLAAAVRADLYENFTDVDCVYSAHPKMVERPTAIDCLTYNEMRELAYSGFGVFHDEALEPVYHAGINVRIANTNNPEAPGTLIVKSRKRTGRPVVGIAASDGFCSVAVSKYLMNRERGFGRRLLQIIEEAGLSYEHTPSGIDTISVILRESVFTPATERDVVERIKRELKPDEVSVERGLALIMVVGEGMHYTVGVAARATSAFARASVNLEMINQGSSEISMMFGVKAEHAQSAVQALYREFYGDREN